MLYHNVEAMGNAYTAFVAGLTTRDITPILLVDSGHVMKLFDEKAKS